MKETYGITTTKKSQAHEHLPGVLPTNLPVHEIVKVDYAIPGCPPERDEVASVLGALLKGRTPQLSQKNVCDECEKKRKGKLEMKLKRITEKPADPERCLLEQGFVCMGPATRAGCHAKCLAARMPCEGCRGPADEKYDQGVAMLDALTSAGRESLSAYPLTTMSAMYHRYSFATSGLGKLLERKK
jgi:F420-non-reducing hydrogenase small subunit